MEILDHVQRLESVYRSDFLAPIGGSKAGMLPEEAAEMGLVLKLKLMGNLVMDLLVEPI
jgi:hypothetical protein